ncbi:hypothetical protein NL676_030711 [Syzygium grande]|nr:hypothetical protein NL676_030711 [Syzygium grande]
MAVQAHRPVDLHDAFVLAHMYEAQFSEPHNRSFSPHLFASSHPSASTTAQIPVPRLPVKQLSAEEMQIRCDKGLCFNCDEKFVRGHRCKGRSTLLYLEGFDDFDDVSLPIESEAIQTTPPEPEVSLNALLGQRLAKSMSMTGTVQGQLAQVLVDGGSTHNFLSTRMSKFLALPLSPITPFQVKELAFHLDHLQQVFATPHHHHLAIKHSKCSFATLTVEFLGHIVSTHGVSADSAKLEAFLSKLIGFDYSIDYKPGKKNAAADALSRVYDDNNQESTLLTLSHPVNTDLDTLRAELLLNQRTKSIIDDLQRAPDSQPGWSYSLGLLRHHGCLFLSADSSLVPFLLSDYHSSLHDGHSGDLAPDDSSWEDEHLLDNIRLEDKSSLYGGRNVTSQGLQVMNPDECACKNTISRSSGMIVVTEFNQSMLKINRSNGGNSKREGVNGEGLFKTLRASDELQRRKKAASPNNRSKSAWEITGPAVKKAERGGSGRESRKVEAGGE